MRADAAAQPAGYAATATWVQPTGSTIHCPVAVIACVDLKAKLTWIQHEGTIVLGPVRMQPGEGAKRTPTGTFTINRKNAVYFSHTYGGAMPYSVFFGHDGIAFHEGTLTGFSHGCMHLSMANAKKFFADPAHRASASTSPDPPRFWPQSTARFSRWSQHLLMFVFG